MRRLKGVRKLILIEEAWKAAKKKVPFKTLVRKFLEKPLL
jgi:hypothetical protein